MLPTPPEQHALGPACLLRTCVATYSRRAARWTSPRRRPPMEQSDAERQLVGLLRGLDVPEFSLQISVREKHSDPLLVGGRGWHLLENPTWTVTMAIPQVAGQRTTMSGALCARLAAPGAVVARRHKSSGVREGRLPPGDGAGQHRAGGIAAAQRRARRGRWRFCDLDFAQGWALARELARSRRGGMGSIGDGCSFAYAWFHDWPWWRDLPEELRAQR
jgi:hypothetical protein